MKTQGEDRSTTRTGASGGTSPVHTSQHGSLLCPPRGLGARGRQGGQRRNQCFCSAMLLGMASHHGCPVIFLRRESLGPVHTRGKGTHQAMSIRGGVTSEAAHHRDRDLKNKTKKDRPHDFKTWQKEQAFHRRGNQMSFKTLQKNSQHHQQSEHTHPNRSTLGSHLPVPCTAEQQRQHPCRCQNQCPIS